MAVPSTIDRLQRILVLAPWVMSRGGATVDEVCRRFEITRDELLADMDLLLVCGLPPFGPGDMIEAFVHGDRVSIEMADWLARPLRLSRGEAIALLAMGRAIAALPGLEEADSLRRALAKLEAAIGPHGSELADSRAVTLDLEDATAGLLGPLRLAVSERRTLEIHYYSHGRAQMSRREVDPLVVFSAAGHWYLAAHDHQSRQARVFRVDRIRELADTGNHFEAPRDFDPLSYAHGPLYRPGPADQRVVIEVAPQARWVREGMPIDRVVEQPDGWTRLELRTPQLAWMARLLLRLGEHGRALEPPALAAQVRSIADRALARYRRSSEAE